MWLALVSVGAAFEIAAAIWMLRLARSPREANIAALAILTGIGLLTMTILGQLL
jgi:hypothetical protein